MFTFDSKHTRSRYKIRAQQQRETFGVVNRRQFGANYIPMISFHSQAPHVQGHFEIWKQVFTQLVGSLSSDVFERRTSTGSGRFALLSHDFEQIFGQIVSIRIKTLGNKNTVASRLIKREKGLLPVDVRRSKTSLLKLPSVGKCLVGLAARLCAFRKVRCVCTHVL